MFLFNLIITSLLVFTSCEIDQELPIDKQLLGKWTFNQVGFEVDGKLTLDSYKNENITCGKNYFEFHPNNTFTNVHFFLDADNTCQSQTEKGTYTISNKKLLLEFTNNTKTLEILLINATSLQLKSTETVGKKPLFVIMDLRKEF